MVEPSSIQNVEKDLKDQSLDHHDEAQTLSWRQHINTVPFAGRVGGNQAFIFDRDIASNAAVLQDVPDAAPGMTLAEQFDLRPLRNIGLWKAAALEGMGTFMLVYITMWISMSPQQIPTPPNPQLGNFDNAAFLGPLIVGVSNFVLVTLCIFVFGPVSGAHFNPTITIATFCARLCSLPRMALYVIFQTTCGALAGLLAQASYGSSLFKVGGCWLYSDGFSVADAFVIEFMACTLLLFLTFGVGLDPRQRQLIGSALSPFLVGMTLGVLSFGTAFTRYGYGGASLNPARCFGAFAGSRFPGWHWHHWVADVVACLVYGGFYYVAPPWQAHMISDILHARGKGLK